jgi:hypothetical protein
MTGLSAPVAFEAALVLLNFARAITDTRAIVIVASVVASIVATILLLLGIFLGLFLLLNTSLLYLFDMQAVEKIVEVRKVIWFGRSNPIVLFFEIAIVD